MSITTEQAAAWFECRAANTPMPGTRKMFKIASAALRDQQKAEENEFLTLDELRQMDELRQVYIRIGDGREGYVILEWEYDSVMLYGLKVEPVELDPDFYNMRYNDPAGHFGLHILGWLAYRDKPVRRERWIWNEGGWWECSECSCCPAPWEEKPDNEYALPPFCHGCGSKMNGGDNR